MTRALVAFLGISALFAPVLVAQKSTVCVFQQKQGRAANVDAGFDSGLLVKELLTRTALDVVSITGFTSKEIEAEAQRRQCAWVVTLWRQELAPDSPNYAGTLGGTQGTESGGTSLMLKDTQLGQNTLLDYSLRKGDSHKTVAHGEGDEGSTYGKFADAILKKLGQSK
jgi:hypothetical protein